MLSSLQENGRQVLCLVSSWPGLQRLHWPCAERWLLGRSCGKMIAEIQLPIWKTTSATQLLSALKEAQTRQQNRFQMITVTPLSSVATCDWAAVAYICGRLPLSPLSMCMVGIGHRHPRRNLQWNSSAGPHRVTWWMSKQVFSRLCINHRNATPVEGCPTFKWSLLAPGRDSDWPIVKSSSQHCMPDIGPVLCGPLPHGTACSWAPDPRDSWRQHTWHLPTDLG